jgi:hypothetical protein
MHRDGDKEKNEQEIDFGSYAVKLLPAHRTFPDVVIYLKQASQNKRNMNNPRPFLVSLYMYNSAVHTRKEIDIWTRGIAKHQLKWKDNTSNFTLFILNRFCDLLQKYTFIIILMVTRDSLSYSQQNG